MDIDATRMYRPREIANNGWILSQRGTRSYFAILDLINAGRLKAVNVGYGTRRFNMVSGAEIVRFKREYEGTQV